MTRIRILVVDDEPDFLKLIERRLTKRNVDVETVGTGEEALAFLKNTPVDVVVLDVRMPGMNGIETLKEIRKRFRDVEVILLTGHGSMQSGVEGISQGAYDYILKPFSIDNLLERIRAAHEHARLRVERRENA
jgi:DNA-binding response OmpR family regulator